MGDNMWMSTLGGEWVRGNIEEVIKINKSIVLLAVQIQFKEDQNYQRF